MDRLKLSSKQAKLIKSLKIKKFRYQEKKFLVEGRKNVEELLRSEYRIDLLVCTNEFLLKSDKLLDRVGLNVALCAPAVLASIGTLKTNNDCIAVVNFMTNEESFETSINHVFVFDGLNDPGNLGTIIRTLDWFGFNNIIVSEETTDHYAPKVVNTSKGSFFRVNVDVKDLKEFLEKANKPIFLIEMQGIELASFDTKKLPPSIFILGSESHGISKQIRDLGTESVTIPKFGGAESLNVGIATGILCHHIVS